MCVCVSRDVLCEYVSECIRVMMKDDLLFFMDGGRSIGLQGRVGGPDLRVAEGLRLWESLCRVPVENCL